MFVNGKISICTPTYNRPRLLSELLDSVLRQSYSNWELIITDNSEGNDTAELIAKSYSDPRIRYFKNEKNLGMDGNTLRALGFVTGEYFTFTPDDDIWIDVDKLKKQKDLLDRFPEINCCFSNALQIAFDGSPHPTQFDSNYNLHGSAIVDIASQLLSRRPGYFICILTGLIRGKYLELFRRSWEFGSEEYFMWFLGGSGEKTGFCYDALVAIRDGEHRWEIADTDGELVNYRTNANRRARQLADIYGGLANAYRERLIYFDRHIEIKVFRLLVELIAKGALQYSNRFGKIRHKRLIGWYLLGSMVLRRFLAGASQLFFRRA